MIPEDTSTEEYLDSLHDRAEELADRARTAEAMRDTDYARELRAYANRLVMKAARIRAVIEDPEET